MTTTMTTTSILTHTVRALASGTAVIVDRDGHAHPAENFPCDWIVEVATGNPEPDFPSDLVAEVPCGAPAVRFDDGFACTAGHDHADYCSPAGRVRELEEWAA